jgi:hypothetical protein
MIKTVTVKSVAILLILSVAFMIVPAFQQNAGADNQRQCELWSDACSSAYNLMYYYCYSGEVYDPDGCDSAYALMGYYCGWAQFYCEKAAQEDD